MARSTPLRRRMLASLLSFAILATACSSSTDVGIGSQDADGNDAGAGRATATTTVQRQVAPDPTVPATTSTSSSTTTTTTTTTTTPPPRTPAVIIDALGSIRSVPSSLSDDTETADSPDSTSLDGPTPLDGDVMGAFLGCTISTGCEPEDLAVWAANQVNVIDLATSSAAIDGVEVLGQHFLALLFTGVSLVGYGNTLESATAPVLIAEGERTVAIFAISFADDLEPEVVATETTAGISSGPDALASILEGVEDSIDAGQYTVVMVDWGQIENRAPTDAEIEQIQGLIDIGTDTIIGHGSDFLQRFERISETSVAFNLGNAVSAAPEPLRRDTAVLRIHVDSQSDATCLLPGVASSLGVIIDDPTNLDCPTS